MQKTIVLIVLLLFLPSPASASLFAEKINPQNVLEITNLYSAKLQTPSEEFLFGSMHIRHKPYSNTYMKYEYYSLQEYLNHVNQAPWLPELDPRTYFRQEQLETLYRALVASFEIETLYSIESAVRGPVTSEFYIHYKNNDYVANQAYIYTYCSNPEEIYCRDSLPGPDGSEAIKKMKLTFGNTIQLELSFTREGTLIAEQSFFNNQAITLIQEKGFVSGKRFAEPKMAALAELYKEPSFKEVLAIKEKFGAAWYPRLKELENFRSGGEQYDHPLVDFIKQMLLIPLTPNSQPIEPKPIEPSIKTLPPVKPQPPNSVSDIIKPVKPVQPEPIDPSLQVEPLPPTSPDAQQIEPVQIDTTILQPLPAEPLTVDVLVKRAMNTVEEVAYG